MCRCIFASSEQESLTHLSTMESQEFNRMIRRLNWLEHSMPRIKVPVTEEEARTFLIHAFAALIKSRGCKPEINNTMNTTARLIAAAITGKTKGYGLLLVGGCGNGKTTMLKAIKAVVDRLEFRDEEFSDTDITVRLINATDISRMCVRDERSYKDLCYTPILAIDDFGTEQTTVTNYGNTIHPLGELISKRYERGMFTIISTNLTDGQIDSTYGRRVYGRICEMCERVVFQSPNFRHREQRQNTQSQTNVAIDLFQNFNRESAMA